MICGHCAGWGRPSIPSTHQRYGSKCEPCNGTGNEPKRLPTTIVCYTRTEPAKETR